MRSLQDESVLKQHLPRAQDSNFQFTSLSDPLDRYILGEDALFLDEDDPYDVLFPIFRGRLNTESGFSMNALLDSLQLIWEWAIAEHLQISLDQITVRTANFSFPSPFTASALPEIRCSFGD